MTPKPNLLNYFPSAYSIRYAESGTDTRGKQKAGYQIFRQPLPDALFLSHFAGKQAISVQPILETGNTCQWGAIDIDIYGDPKLVDRVRATANLFGLTCYIEQSKSLGVHVYIFLDRPTLVKPFRKALQKLAIWLGHPKAEIRPVQDEINFAAGDLGTFMALPGFGIGIERAKEQFAACTMTLEDFDKLTFEGDFSDGPACLFPLQRLGEANGFSNRNLFLYQLAVYYRYKFPSDWQKRVTEYNSQVISDPLPDKEVVALIGQLEKNAKCHYRCSGEPFEAVCNKVQCQFRKFGIASREATTSIVSPEGITILDTDPPTWFVTLENPNTTESVRVKLNTDQLINVNNFKKRCLEAIRIIPTLPKQKDWEALISGLLASAQHLPVPFEMTEEARVLDAVYRYCLTTIKSNNAEDILRGRVWLETDGKQLIAHFRQVDFTNYLASHRAGNMKSAEIHAVLSDLCRLEKMQVEKLDLGGAVVTVFRVTIESRYLELQAQIEQEKEAG